MEDTCNYISKREDLKTIFNISKEDQEILSRLTESENDILVYYDGKILFLLRDPQNKDKAFVCLLISNPFEQKEDRYIIIEKTKENCDKYTNNQIDYKTFMTFELNDLVIENIFTGKEDIFNYADKEESMSMIKKLKDGLFHTK